MGIAIFAYKTQGVVDILCCEDGGVCFGIFVLFLFFFFAFDLNQLSPEWRSLSPKAVPTLGLVRDSDRVVIGHSTRGEGEAV